MTGFDHSHDDDDLAETSSPRDDWQKLKAIVSDALDLPQEERAAFLRDRCGANDAMLAQAQSLLAADDEISDEFLADGPWSGLEAGLEAARFGTEALIGKVVGGFRVETHIASGGMGAVYRALQEVTGQTVALKVMRPGAGGEVWRQRFAHEVRILAQLQHAAIAKIFDAGMYEDTGGHSMPYFAMEFVDGLPLAEFVETKGLAPRQIVALVLAICEGVHHAHQRGVIHRDLKPDNILVVDEPHASAADTDPDGYGLGKPKILDFGIARAADAEKFETTQLTQAGQLVGTMAYMSPEQLSGNPDDVDIRSDVYALGVILFELLAHRKPYRLDAMSLIDAARVVEEVTPDPLGSMDRSLSGDLETIVGVALEKDPQRRYQSVSELSADMRRFLNDEVITARPASKYYSFRKFARRNRGLVVGVASAVMALVLGAAGTAWGMFDAIEQKNTAIDQKIAAQELSDFLAAMLTSADNVFMGRNLTVVELLDWSAGRIDERLGHRPEECARLHSAFGWNYYTFGFYKKAEFHMDAARVLMAKAYGEADPRTLAEGARYCESLIYQYRLDEAGPQIRAIVATAKEALGADSEQYLAASATLASWHATREDFAEAKTLYREVVAGQMKRFGLENNYTLSSMSALGNVLSSLGEYTEARDLYQTVFDKRTRFQHENHAQTLLARGNLANVFSTLGDHATALSHFREVLARAPNCWSEDHHHIRDISDNYATALQKAGQPAKALEIQQKCYEARVKYEGADHPETMRALNNLCVALLATERVDEALGYVDKLVASTIDEFGPDSLRTGRVIGTRAEALALKVRMVRGPARAKALGECSKDYGKALALHEKHAGPRHPSTIILRNNFGVFLLKDSDPRDAVPVLRRVVEDWEQANPELRSVQRLMRFNLARAMLESGQRGDAEKEFLCAWSLPPHPKASNEKIAGYLVQLYEAMGSPKAEEWRKRAGK